MLVLVCVLVIGVLAGCDSKKEFVGKNRAGVIDYDFTALVTKTDNRYMFEVEVKKANPKSNRNIGGLGCVADLVLKDSSGRALPTHSEETTDVFGSLRSAAVDSLKGKVRLI